MIHTHFISTKRILVSTVRLLPMLICSAAANASERFFMGLGDLPGGSFESRASGISADGSTVVGSSHGASGNEAFRWTASTGMVSLGEISVADVSGDGSVIVGTRNSLGFRWTQSAGFVGFGRPFGGIVESANAVSDDGFVIAGRVRITRCSPGSGRCGTIVRIFRWVEGSGVSGTSMGTTPTGISEDGSVIVGGSTRWSLDGGLQSLGDLPGGLSDTFAWGASADGSIIVGEGNSTAGEEAFRWTENSGIVGLGDLAGGSFRSSANAASADGSIVVGQGRSAFGDEAFLWDATHGMRSLMDVLVNDGGLGASLAGWTLISANDISADGQFIAGTGTNPNGDPEGWLARLAPAPPGDFNEDGTVDAADYVVWRKNPAGIFRQSDFNIWRTNFGRTAGSGVALPSAAPLLATVPEPAAVGILVIGCGTSMIIATRRRPQKP